MIPHPPVCESDGYLPQERDRTRSATLHAAVVVRVIPRDAHPPNWHDFARDVHPARPSQIRVEECTRAIRTCRGRPEEFETHDVVKAVREILRAKLRPVIPVFLF